MHTTGSSTFDGLAGMSYVLETGALLEEELLITAWTACRCNLTGSYSGFVTANQEIHCGFGA